MIRVLFVRHGATAGNLERRYIGSTDEPLCPLGVAQIQRLQGENLTADYLFVSPMLRTRQTAELLFPDLMPQVVEDFRETDFGVFENKTASELSDDAEYQTWIDTMCQGAIPGGEQVSEFKSRCCNAFQACMEKLPEDCCAAFVVHGGVIMSILEEYAQPHRDFYDYHVSNGACVECWYEDGILVLKNALDEE